MGAELEYHRQTRNSRCATQEFHEVWDYNFEDELSAFVAIASQPNTLLALDTEFPGCLLENPRSGTRWMRHQVLRQNVDELWPIQMGFAVSSSSGLLRGVWTFNLRFDAAVDPHTEESLDFLAKAGIDFPKHRSEGIDAVVFGRRLARSSLVGQHETPCWLTFAGSYDFAYLLKLLTGGQPLPGLPETFDIALSVFCRHCCDLRDFLPKGSLEGLGRSHGVPRQGAAHTAGSDALLTLELFLFIRAAGAPRKPLALRNHSWCSEEMNNYNWASEVWREDGSMGWDECWSGAARAKLYSHAPAWYPHPNVWAMQRRARGFAL